MKTNTFLKVFISLTVGLILLSFGTLVFAQTTSSVGTGLTISKKVINLTSGNLNWTNSVSAKPGDVLSFAITMQAGSQDIHNIIVKDILPAGLIYKGNTTINASLSNLDPSSGINVGTIPANGIEVVSFQAFVAPSTSFAYGNISIDNTATITGTEIGTQTANASVLVNNAYVAGVTNVPTGLTNNIVKDSFFFPMFLIILMSYLYFTGKIYIFADYLGEKIN